MKQFAQAPVLSRWSAPEHLGARLLPDGTCAFRVWAPVSERVSVRLPERNVDVPLQPAERGYHEGVVADVAPGTRYCYVLDDGSEVPDPASRSQPDGVHAASALVAPSFDWTDHGWPGRSLADMVIYELHVGTFTPEGTFEAVIPRLGELRALGITAIELMPVAQFPGTRNWGYDGVFPFAVQHSYGGAQGLKRLVDAAHSAGIAVVLDVVYNHLGPEGNYLPKFGPYFTDRYRTPWGDALNFDGPGSDEVRAFFLASARQWIEEFHIDALRLDAVHAIIDHSAYPFLRELADVVGELARRLHRHVPLVAESDLGDPRMISSGVPGGLGMAGQWVDDFHHALHALLTGEREGYYQDYGAPEHLARAFRHGYVYQGEYSPFRGRRHGRTPQAQPAQFVVFAQNHDQIGNRLTGDRLAAVLPVAALQLTAAATLLSPFVPLLYMGEEYGEQAPFPYFVSHADPELVAAVRRGRAAEFAAFEWAAEPPDPQAEATFRSAILDWEARHRGHGAQLLALHRRLLALRGEQPLLTSYERIECDVHAPIAGDAIVRVRRDGAGRSLLLLLNPGPDAAVAALPHGAWTQLLDTANWPADGTAPVSHFGTLQLAPWAAVLLEGAPA